MGLSDSDEANELPPATSSGSRQFDDYALLEEVGRGGMGVVYRARQISLNRIVAVKMLVARPFAVPELEERLHLEAEAAAGLSHPNIVTIYDFGECDDQFYFSMEYVEGRSLAQLTRHHSLAPIQAAQYLKAVAEAVHHAHEHGILHRDLKPSNILIDLHDQVKVTDFGLAKRLGTDSELTLTGQLVGSPNYLSPEQAAGRHQALTVRSDVYSLGAVLYQLLTARPPLVGQSLQETLVQIREKEAPSPRLLSAGVPRDLETICLKCLEKEPGRRYDSAQALAADLGRFLERKPILARPVSAAGRVWRWWRRNPALASALAGCVLALLMGVIGIAWQWKRVETEARVAQRSLYESDMLLAQQALKLNNLGKARRLLDRHRPQPGEEDLRGWEWRYLWQLTRSSALGTLTNRRTSGHSVSLSPDGTHLAVGWVDGRVDLWDVPGRRWVQALTDIEDPYSGRVAFSPVRNLLAATSEPKMVNLYDLDSGRDSVLWRAPDQGRWRVRDVTFTQDGSKVVIYAGSTSPELGDAVWVVNVSSAAIENHFPTVYGWSQHFGAARLAPDNRRLYLAHSDFVNSRFSIQCLDLSTGQALWQTERQRDRGLSALDISPNGRVLASGSGFEDPTIRIWDAATGRLIVRLDGHTGWVSDLRFSRDGRRLISAASDQTIRFWDTSNWTETQVLRGHSDEVYAVAISDSAQLVASASRDGDLVLWRDDGNSATEGYTRLPEELRRNEVLPLDHSRVLLLPQGKPPECVDLKHDSAPVLLRGIKSSSAVLGWFGTNLLCHWNGTNAIVVSELRGSESVQRVDITLDSGMRPSGAAFSVTRQLLAWTEGTSATSVHLANIVTPGHRVELRGDVPGLIPLHFCADGTYLSAMTEAGDESAQGGITIGASLRVWNVETRQIVASIDGRIRDATFAAGGRVLVVATVEGNDHELGFYDLALLGRAIRRVPGKFFPGSLAVSPDGGLVASSTHGGLVHLFDPTKGELIQDLHGHLNGVFGVAFSADGRRLISVSGGREAVKLWDVGTRQELLTLGGAGSMLVAARWSADGDVILAGPPWQAWRAPSWEEIAAAESQQAKDERPR